MSNTTETKKKSIRITVESTPREKTTQRVPKHDEQVTSEGAARRRRSLVAS